MYEYTQLARVLLFRKSWAVIVKVEISVWPRPTLILSCDPWLYGFWRIIQAASIPCFKPTLAPCIHSTPTMMISLRAHQVRYDFAVIIASNQQKSCFTDVEIEQNLIISPRSNRLIFFKDQANKIELGHKKKTYFIIILWIKCSVNALLGVVQPLTLLNYVILDFLIYLQILKFVWNKRVKFLILSPFPFHQFSLSEGIDLGYSMFH
jgi:hypothetical protein